MVQVPAAIALTLAPETLQMPGVMLVKVTELPDAPPVATSAAMPPTIATGGAPKLTVCAALPMVMLNVACGAGLKEAFPAWSAAIVQMPAAMPVTMFPTTVQIPVVRLLYAAGKPELAVAETVPVPANAMVGATPKLKVWLDLPTLMSCEICGAAA